MGGHLRPDLTEIEDGTRPATSDRRPGFSRFQNVPELLRLWHTFADVKTAEDLNLPTPAITARASDGQRAAETVLIQPTNELQAYIEHIADRADAIAQRLVDRETDNMLKVSTDGRAAALDLRLLDGAEEPTGPVKLDAVADTITTHWQANAANQYLAADGNPSPLPGSLQLVFCDLGTPSDEHWDAYHELKSKLIDRGMPAGQIRFMHEAKNDSEKARLFAAARSGHVAVLMGSTKKMGMGTNVQDRVSALHHIDCPWRPADVEQRDGRAIRQGNQNEEVALYRYVVEGSFDAYTWQTVARKAKFIAQLMRGRLDMREIEDIGDTALSATEAKAIASGNPLLLEKAEIDAKVEKLTRQERAHHRAQTTLEYNRRMASDAIDTLQHHAEALQAAQARSIDTSGENFHMTVAGTPYTRRADAAEALATTLRESGPTPGRGATDLATIGGQTVIAERISSHFHNGYELSLQDVPRSASTHLAENALSPNLGIIRQLENKVTAIPHTHATVNSELDQAHKTISQADARLGALFPFADELDLARAHAARINQRLAGQEPTDTPALQDPPEPGESETPTTGPASDSDDYATAPRRPPHPPRRPARPPTRASAGYVTAPANQTLTRRS
ncbi:helicase-related protein [Ruania zhangjianzhongii]|uniref:helicase-related protein n=1 Tax=Ruania zhangjianzhongii TaxID=2603206 RepID=UPI0011C85F5F|nr:helicase-related protein [Ruania zhangjianzhongii]